VRRLSERRLALFECLEFACMLGLQRGTFLFEATQLALMVASQLRLL